LFFTTKNTRKHEGFLFLAEIAEDAEKYYKLCDFRVLDKKYPSMDHFFVVKRA